MADHRISVLHILTDGSFGGALGWLDALMTSADHRCFRYGIILPESSVAAKKLANSKAKIIALDLQKASFSLADLRKLGHAIADFSPDIVQTHGALSARLAAFFAAPQAFLILTKHCVFESKRSRHSFLARTSYMLLRPFTHASIATAQCAKALLEREGFPSCAVLTIKNGTPPLKKPSKERLRALRKELALPSCIVGFCGRLEKEKNPRFLIDLATFFSKQTKDFCILVIGDGKERKFLETEAAKRKLAKHFRFLGYQANPLPYLALCDVQINCSLLSETSSLALIEGFSIGIPALASSLDGNRELIKNGKNGFIYPKGNAHACASLLFRMTSERTLLEELSREARNTYDRAFSSARMAAKCEHFYRMLLAHS